MYDPIEQLNNRLNLSDISILEIVDEYTIYCFYLGFEPQLRTSYRSFVRGGNVKSDDNPSFSMFLSKSPDREYMWKDSGLGIAGDIFRLIKLMFGYDTHKEVYERVDQDFNLGYTTGHQAPRERITNHSKPKDKSGALIKIASRPFNKKDLAYWAGYGVSKELLKRYRVHSLKFYWLFEFQEYPCIADDYAYGYEVMQKYKIYQPFAKKANKFRTDYNEMCLEGFAQLQYDSDLLIITKSTKDVLTLKASGYEAVSPRGENTLIPYQFLNHFDKKYQRILILFDNDMKHKGDEYKYPKIYVPLSSSTKDISDYRKAYGAQKTADLMERLIAESTQLKAA